MDFDTDTDEEGPVGLNLSQNIEVALSLLEPDEADKVRTVVEEATSKANRIARKAGTDAWHDLKDARLAGDLTDEGEARWVRTMMSGLAEAGTVGLSTLVPINGDAREALRGLLHRGADEIADELAKAAVRATAIVRRGLYPTAEGARRMAARKLEDFKKARRKGQKKRAANIARAAQAFLHIAEEREAMGRR